MGINWWQLLAVMLATVFLFVIALVFAAWRHDKVQKAKDSSVPRVPEVGDHYLILDHVWRVRSRHAYSDRGEIKHMIYREVVLKEGDLPFDQVCHTSDGPEFYTQWKYIGNPEKDKAKVQKMVAEMAIKKGVPEEEVVAALSSETGEVDMSKLDADFERDQWDRTLTGHAGYDHPENHGLPNAEESLDLLRKNIKSRNLEQHGPDDDGE